MNIRSTIPQALLNAATTMLQPYTPELSPQTFVAALKSYDNGKPAAAVAEKPLTRQETAALLGVSLNSVNRYVNEGRLRATKISKRLVRIDPQSIRDMLNGVSATEVRP